MVGAAPSADVAGVANAGAVYVWAGGGALVGAPGPSATLTVAGAVANDRLGQTGGQGVQLGDVTGDGVFDLVVGASSADVGGVVDTGAAFLATGGAPLLGTPAPSARHVVVGAVAGDGLAAFWYQPALTNELRRAVAGSDAGRSTRVRTRSRRVAGADGDRG